MKERYSLPDLIHYFPDFKPGILQPPSTNQGDLNSLKDADCGGSTAVEDASTEASVPPRTSDEPELGNPAALP